MTVPTPDFNAATFPQLAEYLGRQIDAYTAGSTDILAWAGGAVDGGVDGYFPVPDGAGGSTSAPSPAKLVSLLDGQLKLIGLWTELPNISIPPRVETLMTLGFHRIGVGAGTYVAAPGVTLPPSGKGVWWNADKNGRQFQLAREQEIVPTLFGATVDGEPDDALAVQAAHDYVYASGRHGEVQLGSWAYTCLTPIEIDPTTVGLVGRAARLDFSGRQFTDPGISPELCADPDFSLGLWQAGTLASSTRREWTTGPEGATHTNATTEDALYGDLGIKIPLVPGGRYRITYHIDSMQFAGASNSQDYCSIGVQTGGGAPTANGIGYGGGESTTIYGPILSPGFTSTFDFNAPGDAPADGCWLTLKSSNQCRVRSVSVRFLPDNACLKVTARPGSPQYEHQQQSFGGFRLRGGAHAEGIVFNTKTDTLSSRIAARNIYVDSCDIGIKFMDRAYIIQFYGCAVTGGSACLEFVNGAQDAGENLSFFGCTFSNGQLCVLNSGNYEMNFFGCSFDYCTQFVRGGGTLGFSLCHFEGNRPPTNNPMFVAYGGAKWTLTGGYILLAGQTVGQAPAVDALFNITSVSDTVTLIGVGGYNWFGAKNCVAVGDGRLMIQNNQMSSNPNVPGATMRNDQTNALGASGRFEAAVVGVDAYLIDYDDRVATARNTVGSSYGPGAATFQPTTLYPRAGGANGALLVKRTGVFSNSPGKPSGLNFRFPISKAAKVYLELYVLFPNRPTANYPDPAHTGSVEIYFEANFRQFLYQDRLGRPVYSENYQFFGEQKPLVSLDGTADPTWRQCSFTSMNFDYSNTRHYQGYAPEWANCIVIDVNEQNLPAGADMVITDIGLWEWR